MGVCRCVCFGGSFPLCLKTGDNSVLPVVLCKHYTCVHLCVCVLSELVDTDLHVLNEGSEFTAWVSFCMNRA